ncbi:unnamed protein product [Rotaria socialis]|uniref:Fructose-bisphosphate aldolase n=1 Tax=Rotaria socialis TaxID=392032 RepID=A0A818JE94_9BILA|nr:unnamed protein product [Rotaria socialis]CAF4611094.1 unnamed protein product [Rotaria socialis]
MNSNSSIELMLKENAEFIVQQGKGILAADESPSSIVKRFNSIGVENTTEQRRIYRQLLFTTPDIQQYISGVIMHEETFNQTNDSSVPFPMMLSQIGILPGIKLDRGLESLTINTNETTTLGFDDLEKRCEDFFNRGARFAKWRCVLRINKLKNQPTDVAIAHNAIILARYASVCQAKGLVPIIEPEVIPDGDHDINVCQYVTEKVLAATFKALSDYDIYLEGCLLKPNMVTSGQEAKKRVKSTDIGERKFENKTNYLRNVFCLFIILALATITTLSRTCPPALAGIVFLSGGQSEEDATINLNEMNKTLYQFKRPWPLTFSYGRALQASALKAWSGKRENEFNAQQSCLKRAAANAAAAKGEYDGKQISNEAKKNLHVAEHNY